MVGRAKKKIRKSPIDLVIEVILKILEVFNEDGQWTLASDENSKFWFGFFAVDEWVEDFWRSCNCGRALQIWLFGRKNVVP